MRAQRFERIAGVKEDLPAGERVLWQGAPAWRALALHAFHVREIAVYFALLSAVAAITAWADGQSVLSALLPAALGAVACALLTLLAWLSGRTTIYAITTGRVFLRVGIALPIFLDLPLRCIEGAELALHAKGCGDLPLRLEPSAHLAFAHLWPHARPWRLQRPEPMLRSIPEAKRVGRILGEALRAAHGLASAYDSAPATATHRDAAPRAAGLRPVATATAPGSRTDHPRGIGAAA